MARRRSASSTDASMVAMFGWIMPEPFAMPPTRKRCGGPPDGVSSTSTAQVLRQVSVVRIASASSWHGEVRAPAAASIPRSTFSMGSGTPITPVETARAGPPACCSTSSAMRRASARPLAPVMALAFPEFTHRVRSSARRRRVSRPRSTQAAGTSLRVNTAAAGRGPSAWNRARSGAPLSLTPLRTPAPRQPGTDSRSPSGSHSRWGEGAMAWVGRSTEGGEGRPAGGRRPRSYPQRDLSGPTSPPRPRSRLGAAAPRGAGTRSGRSGSAGPGTPTAGAPRGAPAAGAAGRPSAAGPGSRHPSRTPSIRCRGSPY